MCKVMLKKNQFGWGVQKSTERDIKDRKHDCAIGTGMARAKMEWWGGCQGGRSWRELAVPPMPSRSLSILSPLLVNAWRP